MSLNSAKIFPSVLFIGLPCDRPSRKPRAKEIQNDRRYIHITRNTKFKIAHVHHKCSVREGPLFESPNIPGLIKLETEPSVEMNIDVKGTKLDDTLYEVVLTLTCKGNSGDVALFVAELSYASLVSLNDVPDEQIQRLLVVDCPTLMFPFARNIIAEVIATVATPYIDADC